MRLSTKQSTNYSLLSMIAGAATHMSAFNYCDKEFKMITLAVFASLFPTSLLFLKFRKEDPRLAKSSLFTLISVIKTTTPKFWHTLRYIVKQMSLNKTYFVICRFGSHAICKHHLKMYVIRKYYGMHIFLFFLPFQKPFKTFLNDCKIVVAKSHIRKMLLLIHLIYLSVKEA